MLEFFRDDAGALSCTRLLAFIIVLVVLGTWVTGNIMAGEYIPLPGTEAGVISMCIVGKTIQGYYEYGTGASKLEHTK